MENGKESAFPIKDECSGLNKREYFAGLAMQGLLANWSTHPQECAKRSIQIADELLKQLSNTP